MKKILVPVDFSDRSMAACQFAAKIAEKNESRVILLYVVEFLMAEEFENLFGNANNASHAASQQSYQGENAPIIMKAISRIRERLQDLQNEDFFTEVEVDYTIETGSIRTGVMSGVESTDADAIIMATHGTDDLEDVFSGSNTERIVRYAPVPVIVIKTETEIETIKRMAFVSDFSEEAVKIFPKAREFAQLFNSDIELVNINTINNFTTTAEERANVAKFVDLTGGGDYKFTHFNARTEEEGIHEYVREENIDMIIIGTRGRSAVSRFFTPSISEAVVNHSEVPTITLNIND